MTTSTVFLLVSAVAICVVAAFFVRTLLQLTKTLEQMDRTMTDVQRVLDHAERIVVLAEQPVRTISHRIADLERGTHAVGRAIDRVGVGIIRPLAVTATVLDGATRVLGLTPTRKGGNHASH
jgi:hypothetical protein